MIKFKQLFKENMPALPKNLNTMKERWQVVKYFPDPYEPVQQREGYVPPEDKPIAVVDVGRRGASDDELSDASVDMFEV